MIIFDIFTLFLTNNSDKDIFKKEKTLSNEDLAKYVFNMGFLNKIPTFIWSFDLIDSIFRFKNKGYEVAVYSRYNEISTNEILFRMGIKNLPDKIFYHPTNFNENDIIFTSYDDYPKAGKIIKLTEEIDTTQLNFDNLWTKGIN